MELTKTEQEELRLIAKHQPVFPGDVLSHSSANILIKKGLVLKYEGDYCLTEKGKAINNLAPGKP